MTWRYEQATGWMIHAGVKAKGYAGGNCGKDPEGINNPDMQSAPCVGPLPVGKYLISEPVHHPKLGPYAMPLIPHEDNTMFGRAGFYIHGDSIAKPGSASEGCIILPRVVRETIWESGDHDLEVVSGA